MNPADISKEAPEKVTFHFEGRKLEGIAGEPIAKALFRCGIRTLSYSLKYHRPRGIHCARGRCGRCHMEVDGIPGVPTCITPLENGMRIQRQDFRPFYAPLFTAAMRMLPLPAGFYYRVFTKPAFLRNLFARNVRKMVGVGRLSLDAYGALSPRPGKAPSGLERLESCYEVIVVGAGISGMSAALSAADTILQSPSIPGAAESPEYSGRRHVLLVDEYGAPGGHSIGGPSETQLASEVRRLTREVTRSLAIEYAPQTIAQGFYPPDTLLLSSAWETVAAGKRGAPRNPVAGKPKAPSDQGGARMRRVTARAFVFASGAYDVIPLFENNETPGILGIRAIKLLLERDGYPLGRSAVVYGAGGALEDAVSFLHSKGIRLSAIVAPNGSSEVAGPSHDAPDDIRRVGNARLIKVNGRGWISSATFRTLGGAGGKITLPCEFLCIAFKGQGAYELAHQVGFGFSFSDASLDEEMIMLPIESHRTDTTRVAYFLAGELAGETEWQRKIEQGRRAGSSAAAAAAGVVPAERE